MKAVGAVRKQQHIVNRVLGLLCVSDTPYKPTPWQSTALGWSTMDRAARDSPGIEMATPRSWTASCINRDDHWSADGPRAAPDCMTDCGCSSMGTNDRTQELFISSMAACAAGPSWGRCRRRGNANVLTNVSKRRVNALLALRPYLGSYYWLLF